MNIPPVLAQQQQGMAVPLASENAAVTSIAHIAKAALVYPAEEWRPHSQPGWSQDKLTSVHTFIATRPTAALMIVQGGLVVDSVGDLAQKYLVHSCRKSFISALIGIHQQSGLINIGHSLADTAIDDLPPSLTVQERQASLLDLLRARSGVYHDAAYETDAMKAARPRRGSYQPG